MTNEKMSNRTNVPLETIKSMFSKKTNPNLETIQKIYSAFPHYSLEWIICGTGEMIKVDDGSKSIENIAGKNLSVIELRQEYMRLIKFENFFKFLTEKGDTFSTSVLAAEFDMTAKNLNKKLEELGVIRKQDNRWILCDEYIGNSYQKAHSYIKNGDAAELDVPDAVIDMAQAHKLKGMNAVYVARNVSKVYESNRKVIDYVIG